MAGRAVVSRFGRGERALLGERAGDQAADAAGVCGAAVRVVSAGVERAVPAEREGWRDADYVSAYGARLYAGGSASGRANGMGVDAGADASAGRGAAIGEVAKNRDSAPNITRDSQ